MIYLIALLALAGDVTATGEESASVTITLTAYTAPPVEEPPDPEEDLKPDDDEPPPAPEPPPEDVP